MSIASIKQRYFSFKTEYLSTFNRKLEFAACIIINIVLFLIQIICTVEGRVILGQMQAFLSIYLAFRFGLGGMLIAVLFNIKDFIIVTHSYVHTQLFAYSIGMIYTIMCALWVMIVGIMSIRQENHRRELSRLAVTDDLTDVYNQRYFHSILDRVLKSYDSVGLVLVDIDNFQMYNDLYGHDMGDIVLKNTAKVLKSIISGKSTLYRYGGDEFAILIKDKDIKLLEYEARRINGEFEKMKKIIFDDGSLNKITLSIGLSEYPHISSSKEELLTHANSALYQAKNLGESRVNFYQDIMLQINKNMKSDEQMIGVFKGLLSTINTKDKYTVGHCERVASYAAMIGEALGLELKEIQSLLYAGLLHDIGKIELPKTILNKIGRLTDYEFELVRQHPIHSANILEPLSGRDKLIDYVKHHHERYDGKGYPDGLAGENISLGARILCVADSFDAMISERPYRKGMSVEDALRELEKCSGSQFDPKITALFITLMKNRMSIKYNYKVEFNGTLLG